MSEAVPPTPPQEGAPGPAPAPDRRAKGWAETKSDLKWASAILFFLLLAMSGALWSSWDRPVPYEENLANVTDALFSTGEYADGAKAGATAGAPAQPGLVAPFEVLSVLLLAALVAGVVIALREKEGS